MEKIRRPKNGQNSIWVKPDILKYAQICTTSLPTTILEDVPCLPHQPNSTSTQTRTWRLAPAPSPWQLNQMLGTHAATSCNRSSTCSAEIFSAAYWWPSDRLPTGVLPNDTSSANSSLLCLQRFGHSARFAARSCWCWLLLVCVCVCVEMCVCVLVCVGVVCVCVGVGVCVVCVVCVCCVCVGSFTQQPESPNVNISGPRPSKTVMTDFGQSNFGQSIFAHRVLLANFGRSIFGQNWCLMFWLFWANDFLASSFGPICVACVVCVVCVVCVLVCVCVLVLVCVVCCVLCVVPPSAGPPTFSLSFFSFAPLSLSVSGCLLVEFWWYFRRPGPSSVHAWSFSGCPVKSWRLRGHDPRPRLPLTVTPDSRREALAAFRAKNGLAKNGFSPSSLHPDSKGFVFPKTKFPTTTIHCSSFSQLIVDPTQHQSYQIKYIRSKKIN